MLLPDIRIGALNGEDPAKQLESIVKQLNEWGRLLSNEDRTKIIKDDAGTQRFLQGYQRGGFSNGDVGAKVSQLGTDVATATDDELIWSTDFNLFKIVDSGEATVTRGDSVKYSETLIPHNLGFSPISLVFLDLGSYVSQLPYTDWADDGTGKEMIYSSTDNTNLTIGLFVPPTSEYYSIGYSRSFKYYILRETAVD